ncbi:CYFA0S04e02234g1_1 [Cyberlindnera fabianii]|uniref:CYFA0S04e02234g1_1 n=1 Tax=Cyberlindnera fabianii TaxID=36022 RepID=A0A061AZ86_CYBFA|nr:Ribosomal lysine N-methyltransferase 3 [Cyberlindnera fabianii]CDR40037.1 CYFA0S04e02234g1_1 [Cyberlindnera fabianii]
MSNTSLQNAEKVIQWIKSNDGFWDEAALELRQSPLGGVGVFAKENMDPSIENRVLLRLHKDTLLSFQKSYVANLIIEEQIEGALALVLAFIYEKHKLEESPWKDYISTIDYIDSKGKPILPPSLWKNNQKLMLQGTELEMMGALDESENQDAFERACTFAINQHESSGGAIEIPYELDIVGKEDDEVKERYEHFIAISHAVASRDFEIDEFHQVALCPGADLFNHEIRNNVRFESYFEVCVMCGALACDHVGLPEDNEGPDDEMMSDDEEEDENENESDPGSEVEDHEKLEEHDSDPEHSNSELDDGDEAGVGPEENSEEEEEEEEEVFDGPIEDFITHIEAQFEKEKEEMKQEQEQEDAKYPGPKLNIHDLNKTPHPDECCDIVLHKKVSAGDELFNTYGDFSNTILLSKYGFVIPGNVNDTVSLGLQILKLKKKKQFSRHFQWWEEAGYDIMREYINKKSKHHHDHEDGCEEGCEDGCQDGCCDDEEEDDEVPSWSMEMRLLNNGEPSPLTFALLKLLSFNAPELHKFLQKKTKINLQLLTTNGSKAYKMLAELVDSREKLYADMDFKKFAKKGGYREKLAAQLVLDELSIIKRAKNVIKKQL